MKLRLPHKFQAALLAAIASVSFTTLSTGTLGAAFFVSGQAFAEDAEEEPSATIDIGDTNLDAQAAMEEEEGTAEKEPGSAPINEAGFNGGPGNNAGLLITESVDIDETALDAVVSSEPVAATSGSADSTPSDNLGFTSNPYATGSDTSNGSDDFFLTGTAPAAAYVPGQTGISAEEGDSAAGTGSGSSTNKTTTGAIGSIGGTGSGATGGSVARPMALTAPNLLSPVSSLSVDGTSLGGDTSSLPESTMLGAAGAANDQTLHVYILTGQSNSLGAVKSVPLSQSKLDAYFTEGAMLWNANLHKGGDYYVPAAQQAWQDVEPQEPSISSGGPSNLCMGPEYGFTHMLTRLAEDNRAPQVDAEHLAIIKFSLDGGGNGYWVKGGSGSSYANMLDAAKRALVAAKDKGFATISLDGLMYLQGESDNGTEAAQSATRYQAFITNLSTDLKTWMQQENITGITVSFDSNSVLGEPMLGNDTRKTVNNNFINLAGGNVDKNGYGYVYTDDLGHIGDKLHFTGEAQLTIGARYAYAFAVQNNYDVGAVRGANKSAALDTAGAWWMEAMPSSTDVVKWDVSSCSTVNTISSSLTVGGILVEDPYNNAVFITGGSLDIGASGIEVQKGALNVSSAVNVASSQSWRSQNGFAINTTGNVTIASDATLTLQDGAVVNFHSIAGAGNLTLGTGSGLVSLGMSAQDFAAATPVGEAHYTEGDNGFFNGSRSIITVSGNLVIAEGTTLGGMDGLTGAIFSVSDDHHSLYAAATSQTDYFVRSGKITYAAGTNAYAATGLILADKGSGNACLSLETNLKDNVSIQVSGTGNAIEIAEGVRLNKASLSPAANSTVTLKGDGTYIATAMSDGSADFGTGVTLGGSADWHGILMLSGTNLNAKANLNNSAFSNASSWVGLSGVTNVDANWNGGTITSNIYFEDTAAGNPAWKYNNGSSGTTNRKTLTFSGKIAGNGTLLKTGSGNSGIYNQNYTFTGDVSGWTGLLRYEMSASDSANSVVTFSGKATTINASVDYTFTDAKVLQLALGSISDGSTGYTFNNAVKVHQLSATGQNITLGSHAKEDGTVTNGSLEISGTATAGTLTLGSGTTATFGGTTNLAGVNGTGGSLAVDGGSLNVSGNVGGTVAINLQSGSVGDISIASGSNVTLSQADGTYGTVTVAADTTLTLGSALNVADMTFDSGAKLDATVDFMRSVTYSGTSTGYRDNSDTENGYQQYSDASFTLVTKSAGTAGAVQGAGLLESWTLVSTADSVVAHGGTVKAGKYYVNTSVDYDAASSTNTAYTGASEMVLNSANATLNLLSNLNANACSGGITTAGGATAIASTINIGSGVTLNADQLTRKGSDTVTLAGSGTFAVAGINSTGKKFNAYDALPAGVSKGTSWFGCLSLNGNIEQLWLNQAPGGSTVRLDGVTGFMGGSSSDNDQIVAEVEIGPGGYTFTNANTGTRNFNGGFSGAGNLVHANQGLANSPNLVFSSNMENFTGSIINQKASAGFTLNFNTGASVVNAASIKNDGTAANMLITMNVNDATTFNTLIDKGQGNINLTVASGKSATFNGNTNVSSLSASGADVALGSGASLAVAGATTVDNLSLAGGNTVAFGNGLSYNTLDAQGVSSMSLSGAVSMGEYLMLGKGTLSVNNVQLDLSRDAWDAALDREGSQYSDGESTVNGYATGMKLILARASRIDGAGYAAASGGSLAGMNLSIEVYGAEEDPECSVGGYAQHLVAMGADTSHTYFVNTEAEYDSSSETSGASTRLVMNRANASLSLASNLNSSVCVGGIVVEAQGTSVIVKSGVDLSAGDIHYGDTLTSICVEDQGTLVLEGFGGSAIALDRLTLEDGSALDLAALTTFAPAQQPVLLQGMGGGSGMMKVNSNAIGDFSGISLLGDAAPGSPQTVVLATASNGIELGSNVDLKNLVIPEQYQAKLSTQAAEGGGYNLVLTLGAASNDLVWDNATSNGLWDSGNNWHASGTTTTGTTQFSEGDNVQFSSGVTNTVALNGDVNAGTMTIDDNVEVTVNTDNHSLTVADLDSVSGALTKTGAGTATFGGSDGVTLTKLTVSGGTTVFAGGSADLGRITMQNGNGDTTLQFSAKEDTDNEYVFETLDMAPNGGPVRKLIVDEGVKVTGTGSNLGTDQNSSISSGWGVNGGGLLINGELDVAGVISFDDNNTSIINGSGTIKTAGLNISNGNTTTVSGGVTIDIISSTGIYSRTGNGTLKLADATLKAVDVDWTLRRTANLTDSNTGTTFDVAVDRTITVSSSLGGSGNLVKTGDGTLTLSGNNSFSGNVTVGAGTLQLGYQNALGSSNASGSKKITINEGGTIDINGKDNTIYKYTLSGGSLVNNGSDTVFNHTQNAGIELTADSSVGGTGKMWMIAGNWGTTTANLDEKTLTKKDSGTFSFVNTDISKGTIQIDAGTVEFYADKTHSRLSGDIKLNGGTFTGAVQMVEDNNITASQTSSANGKIELTTNHTTTLSAADGVTMTLSGVISGAGAVVKSDAGTVTLTGTNTYTGGTTINAGTVATSNTSALGLSTVTIADGATLQVNGELNIGGSGANSYGVLDNSAGGTIDLTNDSFLKLHAGSAGRTYNLGNVDVSGSASISEEWNDATVNIANINGGAGDTLALISNHSNTRGTWNIGTATGKAQNFTGTLILNDSDTNGNNKRAVDFKFKDGSMFKSASIQLRDGEYNTDRTDVMENNIVLAASEVSFGSVSDLPAQGTHTRPSTWTVKSDSDTEKRTLVLDATEGSYTTNAGIGARVNINKTGASSQSFTGDLSAMNGTVTVTAGALTLDNSSSTKGTLESVEVTDGTLALDGMNVAGAGAITLNSGTLDLMSATTTGSLDMDGGTLKLRGENWLSSSTGNLAFTSGMLDLSGMTVEAGHDYILATTTSGSLTLGTDVSFKLSNQSLKDQFTLLKQGESLVLTFVTTEDLIWSGGNGNWSSNHWHTETAPDTPVSFTDGHNVTFESGEAEVTLTQNVTAPTTTLKSGAEVKVVPGSFSLNTTMEGEGTLVLAASQMALPSGVNLSSSDWHGVVRISGSQPTNGWNFTKLDQIASTIEFAGVEGYFSNPGDYSTISLSSNVIFSNAGSHNAAIYISDGFSKSGGYEFAGNVSGTGTVEINRDVTQHFIFSGDVSDWDGEIKVTNCGSGNDGSWVKFTGSATEVKAAINQTGGTFRVIADADTTFKDNINVQRLEVTSGHTATLEGDVTLTGSQGKGITGNGTVNVAQGGALTFASGVDTISGTLTVSDSATLKLSEMNDAAITTSGTLTLNSGSTLDLSSLTSITGRELTPITLMKGGTITDTDLGGVKLVFAGDVTGGKLSVQNSALVLTFIEPGKTLIWDNNTRNQIWSNGVDDTNWHTPNNPSRHIGFEEYDMVQFTGTGATSVHLGVDVTPARMDVASGKTLTVYTEGNDLTILQDLDARGASVVLNSDNKEEQATRIMGNTTLKNLTLDDGTASLGGHTEVSEKLTVKNDAEVTVSGTMATKALDISGGSSVSLAAGGTALTTKVAGGSTLTVGANSSLGQLTLNSGTVTNNATLTLSNTQDTLVSGTSQITGTGTTITTGIRLEDNSTLTIDGGQTVSITTKNGIIGGSGNGSVLTLGNVTMTGTASWSVAGTVDSVNLTSTTGSGTVFDTNAHSVTVNAGMSGDGNLTKVGHGTLTLNGSNSFSGDTTVSAGTLKVNKADGLTSSANVSVADGATLWFNSPTTANISGNTVIANGGMLHLGSENALLTTGTLTLNDTSVLNLSGLAITHDKTEYVLASGQSINLSSGFDMNDVIVEYGTHPETGYKPSISVRTNGTTGLQELVLAYDVINSNSLYWNGGTADWTGSGTWHDVTTKDPTTFAEFDDVFFDPAEYSDPPAASVQANVTQNTNVHDMHIVAREGEGAAKNTVNVVVNNGQTLTVDFLNADVNTAFIKQGAGTASVGIKDPHFGADVSVTDGILTTQFLDLAGNGMVVDGELNRTGGTLNLEVGRAETPTDVEFRQSVSGVKNFTVNEGSNATFTGQVTVPNGQDIYMDVASDASVTFAHDVSLASNNWIIQGDGTINFDGRVDISEQSGNFNQLNGNVNVNFNSVLSTTTAQIDIRVDPGTNLYIKELDLLNTDQDTLYFTFKNTSSTQVDRDSVQIDKMVVDGSRGIGSNTSKFEGLKDYQAGGDINIKQLVNAEGDTSNDIARLCHYAGNLNGVTPGGWGIAQVFNIGEATQEGAAFEGIIRLQDSRNQENWAGTADNHKKTVLVLNDEYVASEAVIELKNYSNYSDFAIGINTANAKVTAIEDYDGHAMQNGNYAKVFSGAMDTANTAVPQSDDTLRTLELIGEKDDTAGTVHSTSAGVDRNLNIVKDGAGTQVFSGDSSNFDGSVNAKDGLLKFLNTASLTVQDLTLAANGSATDGTLAVRSDAAGSNVGTAEVHGTLKANSGSKLASNLTLAADSVLDVRDTLTKQKGEYADKTDYVGGLDMLGNSLTLHSGAYLSNEDRSALLSMQWGERYELAYNLSSLTLGDYTTEESFGYEEGSQNNIEASQYFQNLQEDNYYICYSGATGKGPGDNVGTFYIFKAPEPTTSTLSLLALAALAARRRRKG